MDRFSSSITTRLQAREKDRMKIIQFPTLKRRQQVQMDRINVLNSTESLAVNIKIGGR